MPGNLSNADIGYPDMQDKSLEEKVEVLTNYVFMLSEQLRYTLANLDSGNFNETGLNEITEPINNRIKDAEGNMSSISQTANKIYWLVESGTSASNFEMTDRAISQVADNIDLSGFVTFRNLATEGQTTISGGNITSGTIKGIRFGNATGATYLQIGSGNYGDLILTNGYGNQTFVVSDQGTYIDLIAFGDTFLTHNSVNGGTVVIGDSININPSSGTVRIYCANGRYWEFTSSGITFCASDGTELNRVTLDN